MTLPADAAELFRVPPERFVVERDALVARLRADGRDGDAAVVKALRKPTSVVWALNQLASRDPDGLRALFAAGRDLRAAQQAALAGKAADALLIATSARREVVARLAAVVVALLDGAGSKAATQADAIGVALETASIDPEVGAALERGQLERMPSASAGLGFGETPALATVPGVRPAKAEPAVERARLRRARDAAQKKAATRRATADRLAAKVEEARGRLTDLEGEHAAAETEALEAELEAERAARASD